MKFGNLNFWNPLGHSRPVTGLIYLYVKWKQRQNEIILSEQKSAKKKETAMNRLSDQQGNEEDKTAWMHVTRGTK